MLARRSPAPHGLPQSRSADRLCYTDSDRTSGSNSAVECQLPKLDVAGSIPVSRSIFSNQLPLKSFYYRQVNDPVRLTGEVQDIPEPT